jgi:histidyl-tRNA synthetase
MAEKLSTSPYKGSRDFYPAEMKRRNWVFAKVRRVLESFGFEEYDGPMLESFELYAAKTGEEIVSQQLYEFKDRGDRRVAIRPEMTPTLARMVAAQVQEIPKPIRWFSIPNLWRYERPQRGRLREHWQINADLLGGDLVQSNAEILALAASLFSAFGGEKFVEIRFNSRRLMDSLFFGRFQLDPEKAVKLGKVIDAKDKLPEEDFDRKALEFLNAEQVAFLKKFFKMSLDEMEKEFAKSAAPAPEAISELQKLVRTYKERSAPAKGSSAVALVFDPGIMRGLDYYTGLVFEAFDVSPDNRRALFGGGRYDNLIGLFSKSELSGVGFGLGDVTLMNFLETHALLPTFDDARRVYLGCGAEELLGASFAVEEQLRSCGLSVLSGQTADSLKNHLKAASKLGATQFVGILSDEWGRGKVIVKNLQSGDQLELGVLGELGAWAQKISR